jgi:predicted RNA binding protein YcfA (HicA-like mRNA interferase family)
MYNLSTITFIYNKKVRRNFLKQRDLIKKLENIGFRFERHGGNHDIYSRGNDLEKIPTFQPPEDDEINAGFSRQVKSSGIDTVNVPSFFRRNNDK